jgi:hypothetical protein
MSITQNEMEKFKLQAAALAAARAQKTIAIKKVYDRPKPYKWASQLALIAVITGAFSFLGAMGISKIVESIGDAAASKFEVKPGVMESWGLVENKTRQRNKWVKVLISGGIICIGIAIVGTLWVQLWQQVVERNLHEEKQKAVKELKLETIENI